MRWNANALALESIFQAIGRTPMLTLRRVSQGLKPDILVKMEYFNATGSVKDRIYHYMIKQAIGRGELREGMTILESSSGNSGIACAMVGALLGFPVVIVMPSEVSEERKKMIEAYGAQVIETPGGESDIDLCLEKVAELKAKDPRKYWEPNQFENPDNVRAHFLTTGPEIWGQSGGRADIFVAAQGTGGTLTGVGRYLREKNPAVKLFAVEPKEAATLARREWGVHKIEGIGDGFVPRNLDLSILDGVVLIDSESAVTMAKRLAREEGIFCGISSGCNVLAAMKLGVRCPEARAIVTVIPDSGQRYFSTEICGEERELKIPDRSHALDEYSIEQLDRFQDRWLIIE